MVSCRSLVHPATMLPALVLHFVLAPPLAISFGVTSPLPRRSCTPLQAGKDGGGDQTRDGGSLVGGFERMVRKVTRNDTYKFGDITKSVVNTTTHSVEDAVRAVTKDETYHFGDYTKKAIGSTTGRFEDFVRSVTGDEDYEFGDLTRASLNVMTYSEKSVNALRRNNIHEVIELLNLYWTRSMSQEERREVFTVAVFTGAIIILAYNFVSNLVAGVVFAAAFRKISIATGVSPLAGGVSWSKFLEAKSAMDMFFGGPCVPAKAIVTIPFLFKYRKFVVAVANRSPLRERFPIVNRYFSLIISWIVANLGCVGGLTLLMMKLGSLSAGIPIFPPHSI